jgi:hypothetical protein
VWSLIKQWLGLSIVDMVPMSYMATGGNVVSNSIEGKGRRWMGL